MLKHSKRQGNTLLITVATMLLGLVSGAPSSVWSQDRARLPMGLQGTWKAISFEIAGKNANDEFVKKFKIEVNHKTIKWPNYQIQFTDGATLYYPDTKKRSIFRYRFNAKSKPKTVDLISKVDGKETRVLAIYAYDGKQLKLCWDILGIKRPSEFPDKNNRSYAYIVLNRE